MAPGTAAPLSSRTVPSMTPVVAWDCANAAAGRVSASTSARASRDFISDSLAPREWAGRECRRLYARGRGSSCPPVRPPIFSWIVSSTLRAASLTAAVTRSCSISTSSLLTTSGSMRSETRFFWPSITTLTMPPPAAASIWRAAISCCMRSCACCSCFMSFCGLPNGFTVVLPEGPRHDLPRDVDDLAVEEVQRFLDRGLPRGLVEHALALLGGVGGGRARRRPGRSRCAPSSRGRRPSGPAACTRPG